MGNSASSMRFNKEKGCYEFEGEDEQEEEDLPPPPPPPGPRPQTEEPKPEEPLNVFGMEVQAFRGVMPRRKPGPSKNPPTTMPTMPMTVNSTVLPSTEEETQKTITNTVEERSSIPSVFEGLADTTHNAKPHGRLRESLDTDALDEPRDRLDSVTLSHYNYQQSPEDKAYVEKILSLHNRQKEKITHLKNKINVLQYELQAQHEDHELTIDNLSQFCQELRFRGMEDVEDLQVDVR